MDDHNIVDWKAMAAMTQWRSSYSALMDQVLATHDKANKMSGAGDVDAASPSPSSSAARDILDVLSSPEHNLSRGMIKIHILVSAYSLIDSKFIDSRTMTVTSL